MLKSKVDCFVRIDSRVKRHSKGKKTQGFCIISLCCVNVNGYLKTVCSLKHPKYSPLLSSRK